VNCPAVRELPPPPEGRTGWPWTVATPPLFASRPSSPWPRVTIVTPSYNQGAYLEETIRSVLLQNYPNLEYIIMDGGSTDQSVDVILRYERWLTHWESRADQGQSHAINKGWKIATGNVLAWLNSDDLYRPGALAEAVLALSSHPSAAFVYSNVEYIDPQGQTLIVRNPGQTDLKRMLWALVSLIPQPTTFVRREMLTEVGFLDESLDYSMDYDYWLRLLTGHRGVYQDRVWACTRIHQDAKTVARQKDIWLQKKQVLAKIFSLPGVRPLLPHDEVQGLLSLYHRRTGAVCLRNLAVRDAVYNLFQSAVLQPSSLLRPRDWKVALKAARAVLVSGPRSTFWPE